MWHKCFSYVALVNQLRLSFGMSVCLSVVLSVSKEQLRCQKRGFHEILYSGFLLNLSKNFGVIQSQAKMTATLHEDLLGSRNPDRLCSLRFMSCD